MNKQSGLPRSWRFIINPHAGRIKKPAKLKKFIDLIHEHFEDVLDRIEITNGPQHATKLTKEAIKDGVKTIVSVGGDGTHNEVIHGMTGVHVDLGLIPAGSGNDFVLGLKLEKNPFKCLKKMRNYVARPIDIGKVNDFSFLNVMGCGIDADVIRLLEGKHGYASGFYHALKYHEYKDLILSVDGQRHKYEQISIIAVANGRFFGNGMMISPDSVLDDGLLNVIVIHGMSKFKLFSLFPLLYIGQHMKIKKHVKQYKGKNISILSDKFTDFQRDGELFCAKRLDISIIPHYLSILAPIVPPVK